MEIFTGISLQEIFENHWVDFVKSNAAKIRNAIFENVEKILLCKTEEYGFHKYSCLKCGHTVTVPHTCKSRFCSSCGKKATDIWITNNLKILPKTKWQHITFTMPSIFWNWFRCNREFLKDISAIAAKIIQSHARKKKNCMVGIFIAMHTAGRDIKFNIHLHVSTTLCGLSTDGKKWITNLYFPAAILKKMWRYQIINYFRQKYKDGDLVLPKKMKIDNLTELNKLLDIEYKKTWVVHLQTACSDPKRNIEYLGKYLKRPPIGETRIKKYDGKNVTFEFLDHHTNAKKTITLSVFEFIGRLIAQIPDTNFRVIRYYGFLANRVRGKLLPLVYKFLQVIVKKTEKIYITWQNMINQTFEFDPLICPNCHLDLVVTEINYGQKYR